MILDQFLYKEEVTRLLHNLADNETGSKGEQIRRLLNNRYFDPLAAMKLLTRGQLSTLCKQRGKDPVGDKETLIQRLSEVLRDEPAFYRSRYHSEGRTSPFTTWSYIHLSIAKVSESRFRAGHLADSVEAAFKEVNVRVKEFVRLKSGRDLDGSDLMNFAFSPKAPVIRLADTATESGYSEQQGYMLLFTGAIQAIRNPKAHANVVIDETRAILHLSLASLLMYRLDEAGVP